MKLRNKKTGEIVDVESLGHAESLKEKNGYQVTLSWATEYENLSQCKDYHSLAELNEDWEDVKEPLIKDPKIRKAVRAWAEAIEANEVIISHSRHDYLKIIDLNADCDICFDYEIGYTYNETNYTITELCGEEEE